MRGLPWYVFYVGTVTLGKSRTRGARFLRRMVAPETPEHVFSKDAERQNSGARFLQRIVSTRATPELRSMFFTKDGERQNAGARFLRRMKSLELKGSPKTFPMLPN